MSLINGKFHNKAFAVISESADFANTRLHKQKHRIPHRFKHGASSKEKGGFFDESLLTSDAHVKVVKLTGSFNYVGLRFDKYQQMVLNQISESASSTASFNQMSASFFRAGGFGNILPQDSYITLIAEDGEGGTITPSYTLSSASGIVPTSGFLDIIIQNSSSNNTAATWSFSPGGGANEIHQTSSVNEWKHRFFFTGSQTSSFALSGSESGSERGIGTPLYINGSNTTDGVFLRYLVKGKIFGDGEFDFNESQSGDFTSTSSVTFLPIREIIIHSGSVKVRSGSFKFNPTSSAVASSSGVVTTLYYQSGSTGPSGSFTGSGAISGSHVFLDVTLQTPASSGYYAVPGTNDVLHAFRGGINNDVTGSAVESGIEFLVPRFTSRSILN